MFVAKLRFSGFEKSLRFSGHKPIPNIIVPIALPPMGTAEFGDIVFGRLSVSPALKFTWEKQIGKFTHKYRLKEIIR